MPFTSEQFFHIFEKYNVSVFPMQIVLVFMAVLTIWLTLKPKRFSNEFVSGLLGFLWIWTGLVYHLIFFTQINPAAYVFASLFVLQGALFLYEGIAKKRLGFCFEMNSYGFIGAMIIIYALPIYPLVGYLSGRIYPASPTFGAPCPTTIFTFGLLLWTNKNASLHLLIIPILWALIGSFAFSVFGVREDMGMLVAGILALILLLPRKFRIRDEQTKTNVMPEAS